MVTPFSQAEKEARAQRIMQNVIGTPGLHPSDPNYEGPIYEDVDHHTLANEKMKEEIKRPEHYARFPIEPVTFIMMNDLPFWAANVVKYACRAPFKHSEENADLDKIIRYAQMRKEQLKRERENDRAVVWNPL